MHDEFGRVGGIGLQNSLVGSVILPMSAVQKFGSPELRSRITMDVLDGKKRSCLAITEPDAGSNVQGISTEAELLADGKTFKLNGQKKWITGGMFADYFLTLVNGVSNGGKTFLVVDWTDGLSTKHTKTSGSGATGTTFVKFDDVEVPLTNVVGQRGAGFKYLVSNFNRERLFIGMQAVRCARVYLEDAIEYTQGRTTFEKEAAWARSESLVYQLDHMSPQESELFLAGSTGQFKSHAGIVLEHVVREAVQIMGGIGLTKGDRGARVEQIWRDVKAIVVPGGSEEILFDLAVRRALKVQKELRSSKL